MTKQDLIEKLREMRDTAPRGELTAMTELFGILFDKEIRDCGSNAAERSAGRSTLGTWRSTTAENWLRTWTRNRKCADGGSPERTRPQVSPPQPLQEQLRRLRQQTHVVPLWDSRRKIRQFSQHCRDGIENRLSDSTRGCELLPARITLMSPAG